MILINNIFKDRLTDKLNHKQRYFILKDNVRIYGHKFILNLDDIKYCLYYYYKKYKKYKQDSFYIFYYKNGKLHRDGDLPAGINYNRQTGDFSYFYYKNGKQHRDDDQLGNPQPSVYYSRNGIKEYHKNGKSYYPQQKYDINK